MTITDSPLFAKVREALPQAKLVAWDGCHKIYVAMDETEANWFRDESSYCARLVEGTPDEMLTALSVWWQYSCGLRFITAIGDREFNGLILQGEDGGKDGEW